MKFNLHHDPEHKTLTIPRAALQLSNLADAEELFLYVDEGCILLGRKEVSTREAIKTITHLGCVIGSLMTQLVDASQEMAGQPEEQEDPLSEFDEGTLKDLMDCGADPDGLRMLLLMEETADE
mgnify:FL=1